jgi:hypothetical protein
MGEAEGRLLSLVGEAESRQSSQMGETEGRLLSPVGEAEILYKVPKWVRQTVDCYH